MPNYSQLAENLTQKGKYETPKSFVLLANKLTHIDTPEQKPTPETGTITPSQLNFPIYVLVPPFYVDNKIKNNTWMNGNGNKPIDKPKFIAQWNELYKWVSNDALVFLIPPKKGLQDQTYVNCAAYLPHMKSKDTIILSNFTAPGRAGEEDVAGDFLSKLGYKCIKSPYKFEGEPELKWIKDNIYLGGYGNSSAGFRSDPNSYKWMMNNFDMKVIPIQEKDSHLYHLDCTLFLLDPTHLLCCTSLIDKGTLKEIEKVVEIISISEDDAHSGITNSLRCGELILNASGIKDMKETDKDYQKEKSKCDHLTQICNKLGIGTIYFNLNEAMKSGALLSCFFLTLNRNW